MSIFMLLDKDYLIKEKRTNNKSIKKKDINLDLYKKFIK